MFRVKSLHYFGLFSQSLTQELVYFEKVVNKEKNRRRRQPTEESEEKEKNLRLSEMSFALICLTIGFCLSVFVFFIEMKTRFWKTVKRFIIESIQTIQAHTHSSGSTGDPSDSSAFHTRPSSFVLIGILYFLIK